MKKLLILLLSLLLCLSLFACGTACEEHIDTDSDGKCDICGEHTDQDDNGDDGNEAIDLVLVEDYNTLFKVVCAISLSDVAEGYVDGFVKDLNRCNLEDRKLVIGYDAPGYDDVTEIIFGSPSYRGDAFIKDVHYLGHTGFSIEVISNKLLVLAGGDEGYKNDIMIAKKLGFKKCILPKSALKTLQAIDGVELIGVTDVKEAISKVGSK